MHVRSGSGATDGAVNGLGNLIVGYDEDGGGDIKNGSHNLVIGQNHTYTNYGGLVAGSDNAVTGTNASVSGGRLNVASGDDASVSGGSNNTASGDNASVSGGQSRTALGTDDWRGGSLLENF